MANDRLYLVCKSCGERQMLFKFYPCNNDCCDNGFPQLRGYAADEKRLDDFMVKHIYSSDCGNRHHKQSLDGNTVFDLKTERDLQNIAKNIPRT